MLSLVNSFKSEWLKKKRSPASWLVLIGGLLVPVIVLFSRLTDFSTLGASNASDKLWEFIYTRCWQFMGIFLLPMGVILAASLITQIEFRNNTWKQLHTTPQSLTTIFIAKFAVIVIMMLQFFILFNIGIFLCGALPTVFIGVHYPKEPFPWFSFMKGNGRFFIDCLPIIALQYLVSLQWKNFLVPLGFGLGLDIASMIALSWKHGYLLPYNYCALEFLGNRARVNPNASVQEWALGYFVIMISVAYILYISKKEKG